MRKGCTQRKGSRAPSLEQSFFIFSFLPSLSLKFLLSFFSFYTTIPPSYFRLPSFFFSPQHQHPTRTSGSSPSISTIFGSTATRAIREKKWLQAFFSLPPLFFSLFLFLRPPNSSFLCSKISIFDSIPMILASFFNELLRRRWNDWADVDSLNQNDAKKKYRPTMAMLSLIQVLLVCH